MAHQCSNTSCCSEVEPLEEKFLRRPKVHFPRNFDVFDILNSIVSRLCGQRKKETWKRPVFEKRDLQKMSLKLRPDDGDNVCSVKMEKVEPDGRLRVILISHKLAMLLAKKSLWRKIDPRSYTDDQGIQHRCEYCIKVSWRWDNEGSTEDAKIYVVSKPNLNAPLRSGIDVLMPTNLYEGEESGSEPAVQPIYVLPPLTQAQKDAAKKKEKELEEQRAAKEEAIRIKKEKEYDEQMEGHR